MIPKKFKKSNRYIGTGKDKVHGYVNNKGIFISKWKASFIERLAFLITGTLWLKIDSKTIGHRPTVYHPFADMPYIRKRKKSFTSHGEA